MHQTLVLLILFCQQPAQPSLKMPVRPTQQTSPIQEKPSVSLKFGDSGAAESSTPKMPSITRSPGTRSPIQSRPPAMPSASTAQTQQRQDASQSSAGFRMGDSTGSGNRAINPTQPRSAPVIQSQIPSMPAINSQSASPAITRPNIPPANRSVVQPPSLRPASVPMGQSQAQQPSITTQSNQKRLPSTNFQARRQDFDAGGTGSTIRDSNVRATSFQGTQNYAGNDLQTSKQTAKFARLMLQNVLEPAQKNLLTGKKFSLHDALKNNLDSQSRLEAIREYWACCLSLADYQFAAVEVDTISRITRPAAADASALWTSEVAAAQARMAEAKLNTIAAQESLHQKMRTAQSDPFPIPLDIPWCGEYRTNFKDHQTGGPKNGQLKKIDRVLPVMWQLLLRRSKSVEASQRAYGEMEKAYQRGVLPVSELLQMHRRLRDQRIAFLASVRDYNVSIADYAMNTSNGSNGNLEKVVAMLIDSVPSTNVAPVTQSNIREANANSDPIYSYKNQPTSRNANTAPTLPPSSFGGTGNGQVTLPPSNFGGGNGQVTSPPTQPGFTRPARPTANGGLKLGNFGK